MIKNNSFDLEKVRLFKNKFFNNPDGKATKRIVDYMIRESRQ